MKKLLGMLLLFSGVAMLGGSTANGQGFSFGISNYGGGYGNGYGPGFGMQAGRPYGYSGPYGYSSYSPYRANYSTYSNYPSYRTYGGYQGGGWNGGMYRSNVYRNNGPYYAPRPAPYANYGRAYRRFR